MKEETPFELHYDALIISLDKYNDFADYNLNAVIEHQNNLKNFHVLYSTNEFDRAVVFLSKVDMNQLIKSLNKEVVADIVASDGYVKLIMPRIVVNNPKLEKYMFKLHQDSYQNMIVVEIVNIDFSTEESRKAIKDDLEYYDLPDLSQK